MRLLDPLFRWAAVEACFSDRARLQGMLDFEAACRRARAERRHLREVLAADRAAAKLLSPEALQRLFDPQQYLGAANVFIDRALAVHAEEARLPPDQVAQQGRSPASSSSKTG